MKPIENHKMFKIHYEYISHYNYSCIVCVSEVRLHANDSHAPYVGSLVVLFLSEELRCSISRAATLGPAVDLIARIIKREFLIAKAKILER